MKLSERQQFCRDGRVVEIGGFLRLQSHFVPPRTGKSRFIYYCHLTQDIHAAFCAQLADATAGEVLRSSKVDWFSVTFAGARHRVELRTVAPPERLAGLPEHQFDLPHAFVADLEVCATDGDRVTVEALVVQD